MRKFLTAGVAILAGTINAHSKCEDWVDADRAIFEGPVLAIHARPLTYKVSVEVWVRTVDPNVDILERVRLPVSPIDGENQDHSAALHRHLVELLSSLPAVQGSEKPIHQYAEIEVSPNRLLERSVHIQSEAEGSGLDSGPPARNATNEAIQLRTPTLTARIYPQGRQQELVALDWTGKNAPHIWSTSSLWAPLVMLRQMFEGNRLGLVCSKRGEDKEQGDLEGSTLVNAKFASSKWPQGRTIQTWSGPESAWLPIRILEMHESEVSYSAKLCYVLYDGAMWPRLCISVLRTNANTVLYATFLRDVEVYSATSPGSRIKVGAGTEIHDLTNGTVVMGGDKQHWRQEWNDLLELDPERIVLVAGAGGRESERAHEGDGTKRRGVQRRGAVAILVGVVIAVLLSFRKHRTRGKAEGRRGGQVLGIVFCVLTGAGCRNGDMYHDHSLGEVSPGAVAHVQGIRVKNGETTELTVEEVMKSCACTEVSVVKGATIQPGGELPLEFDIRTPDVAGEFRHRIGLVLMDTQGKKRTFTCEVSGTVVTTIEVNPRVLTFESVGLNETPNIPVLLQYTPASCVTGVEVIECPKWLSVMTADVRQTAKGEHGATKMKVSFHPRLMVDEGVGSVKLRTTGSIASESREVTLSVRASVREPLTANPSRVSFMSGHIRREEQRVQLSIEEWGMERDDCVRPNWRITKCPKGVHADLVEASGTSEGIQMVVSVTQRYAVCDVIEVEGWGRVCRIPIAAMPE